MAIEDFSCPVTFLGLLPQPPITAPVCKWQWALALLLGVRKNAAHKESSPEKSHIQEQDLMTGSSCLADPGKMAQHRLWARHSFYRREKIRKLARAQ
jgi:hypothetical protein